MAKTVKVRVAVAVDPDGCWNAVGWLTMRDEPASQDAEDVASDGVAAGKVIHWITAELPVPERKGVEVEAQVEEAN